MFQNNFLFIYIDPKCLFVAHVAKIRLVVCTLELKIWRQYFSYYVFLYKKMKSTYGEWFVYQIVEDPKPGIGHECYQTFFEPHCS